MFASNETPYIGNDLIHFKYFALKHTVLMHNFFFCFLNQVIRNINSFLIS